MACAVRATTFQGWSPSIFCTSASTPNPSRPGSWMSSSTSAGAGCSASSVATSRSPECSPTTRCPFSVSRAVINFRLSSWSSTTTIVAIGRELDGVRQQVEQDLEHAAPVGPDAHGLGRRLEGESVAPRLELRAHAVHCFAQQRVERHRLEAEIHAAGGDLRQIEQLVDELQQVPAVARDRLEVVALRVAQRGALDLTGQQQLAESDHAVQRGAELVRNVGEELILELARLIQDRKSVV